MSPRDRQLFELWSRTPEHLARVEQSRREMLACPDGSAVLFSGGKDSLAVLHMAVQGGKCRQCVHLAHDPAIMPGPYQREIYAQMDALCVNGCRQVVLDSVHRDIPEHIPCVIGSFRADENGRRRRGGPDAKAFGVRCRHIIFDWTARDVWAYIIANDLPYHSAYDARAAVEGWDNVRFSAYFASDLTQYTAAVDGLTAWRDRGRR